MAFELWDVEANKYLGRFDYERDALILVRTLVNHYGFAYADKLDLGTAVGEVADTEPISGAALVERVREVLANDRESSELQGVVIASRT